MQTSVLFSLSLCFVCSIGLVTGREIRSSNSVHFHDALFSQHGGSTPAQPTSDERDGQLLPLSIGLATLTGSDSDVQLVNAPVASDAVAHLAAVARGARH